MTLLQALVYFFREAALNLLRGWKVGLLVAVTIGVSLFVGGLFLLLSAGVMRSVEVWRGEARVVAYLLLETEAEVAGAIAEEVGRMPWVDSVELVSSDEARRRFDDAFPGLSELLDTDEPLAPSLELALRETALDPVSFEAWIEDLRRRPEIAMVDDDRQWLRQVELFATLLGVVGYGLGGLLLIAAVLTTASVIRLTAHVYRQEIAVLRLVGGTDFFIRGPFVAEGLLQGLVGGLLAAAALAAVGPLMRSRGPEVLSASGLFAPAVLPWTQLLTLVVAGGLAGLVGAVLSVRWRRLDL